MWISEELNFLMPFLFRSGVIEGTGECLCLRWEDPQHEYVVRRAFSFTFVKGSVLHRRTYDAGSSFWSPLGARRLPLPMATSQV